MVLSPELGAGQLRPIERGPEGELRRGTVSKRSESRERSKRRLNRLVLFDIDGTLVLTGGAGGRAVSRAFTELFQIDGLHRLSMGGRTDRWIFTELARHHGIELDDPTFERIRDTYIAHLSHAIDEPAPNKRVLPGVHPLLEILATRGDVAIALLTGNLERGARIKLEHFDLWRYFPCGAFGDSSPDRSVLLHDAVAAVAAHSGRTFQPQEIVIVGDTPLDVAVALQTGARSLAVTTGPFTADALQGAGADVVLTDLSDTQRVLAALELAQLER